jgi:putative spermidine/putrescine transport system ATP-binding protein
VSESAQAIAPERRRAEAQTPSPGASLTLSGVTKAYADQIAVDGVSLEIRAGEFITLLGPSGSGKTTTLNLIAGFVELDAGEIFLDERPISRLRPHKRNVGMVFQNYALFPHMNAFDNVAFPLRQRRVRKDELKRRVEDALKLVHLEGFGARYPQQLSGGQQQRVALARAIVFNPRVLLMDEPLGALDKKLRDALQLEIMRIHRELGITFVYVTHDQEEALVMSDRIAIFNAGKIAQAGTATELYEQPTSRFVADFIGESNLFHGRLVAERSAAWVQSENLRFRVPDDGSRATGSDVTVVIRPERLELLPATDGGTPADWNAARGRIEDLIYLGNTRKYRVRLDDAGRDVFVRTPVTTAAPSFALGDRVVVAWPPEAAIVVTQ